MLAFFTRESSQKIKVMKFWNFGSDKCGDFLVAIFCQNSPGEVGLNFVTENFTTFTPRKETCHLQLTLGASSPNLSSKDSIAFNRLRGRLSARMWQIFCQFFPGKKNFNLVTENFATFFTPRKETCHLQLTLGASSPNLFKHRPVGGATKCRGSTEDLCVGAEPFLHEGGPRSSR